MVTVEARPELYAEWDVEQTTRAFVASLGLAEGDARAPLCEAAVVCAQRADVGDIRAARELARLIAQVGIMRASGAIDRYAPDMIDQLQAKRLARRTAVRAAHRGVVAAGGDPL